MWKLPFLLGDFQNITSVTELCNYRNGENITMNNQEPQILWGASQIGAAIGRTARQTHYMLAEGAIPARKVGGRWCANRAELMRFFSADERIEETRGQAHV